VKKDQSLLSTFGYVGLALGSAVVAFKLINVVGGCLSSKKKRDEEEFEEWIGFDDSSEE